MHMKKQTRSILSLCAITVLVLALMLSGCAQPEPTPSESVSQGGPQPTVSQPAPPEKKMLGFIIPTFSTPYCVELIRGAEEAMAQYSPDEYELVSLECNYDPLKEIANIEDLVNQGVDGVILICSEPTASAPGLEYLVAHNVPTVIVDSPCEGRENADCVIITDNKEAGRLEMEMLAKGLNGKGNIICLENSTNTNGRIRAEGRDEELKKWPDIKILAIEDGVGTVEKALDVVTNFMQSYPTEIDAIWTFSDTPSQGAIAAISGTAYEGKVLIGGVNASDIAKGFIQEGKQFGSAAQFPAGMAKLGIETLVGILEGKAPEEQTVYYGVEWVSKENVDEFIK
jgi:ribose transport system substrate-binding protein